MSTVVPVGVVSSSIESPIALISSRPRPPLPGLAAGWLPGTGIGDRVPAPRCQRCRPQPAWSRRGPSAVRMLDAVGTRLADDQHDVGRLRSRDISGLQPCRQLAPDAGQLICGRLELSMRSGACWWRYTTIATSSSYPAAGARSRSTVSATASRGKFIVSTKTSCRAVDTVINRLVSCVRPSPSVNSISVEPGGNTWEACGRGSSRRTASGTDRASVNSFDAGTGTRVGHDQHGGHVAGVAVLQDAGFGVQDRQEHRCAVRIRDQRCRRIELFEQYRRLGAGEQQGARRAA